MRKKTFIHKQDWSLFITSADQYMCKAAAVKTFASGAVWTEYDHHLLPDITGFEMAFDCERCDGEYSMRAYKEQASGVVILETGLWDYDLRRPDFDNLSVFEEKTTESTVVELQNEESFFVVKNGFSIRGLDDIGRIAHNFIYIPKGTQFAWVKEGVNISDSCNGLSLSHWHMTSLRNMEIGLEIQLPTKYIGLVMKPIDKDLSFPKDDTLYPYLSACGNCEEPLAVPYDPAEEGFYFVPVNDNLPDIKTYGCLCDDCYLRLFGSHQHTWSFQTEEHIFCCPWVDKR